eukprot:scaffold145_cov261-Pinguiococcus_pyrenoidosus.AAC.11
MIRFSSPLAPDESHATSADVAVLDLAGATCRRQGLPLTPKMPTSCPCSCSSSGRGGLLASTASAERVLRYTPRSAGSKDAQAAP